MQIQNQTQYRCASGIQVRRSVAQLDYAGAIDQLASSLDESPGVLLASSFEFPGRYTRWDIGFVNPPLKIVGRRDELKISALNVRGEILLPEIYRAIQHCKAVEELSVEQFELIIKVATSNDTFSEEQRSRKPSLFSILRELISCFSNQSDSYLGLYGAFGYDLTFQFEDVERFQQRQEGDRDLVLYLPDQIIVADHRIEKTYCYSYEFVCRAWNSEKFTETTGGFRRTGQVEPYVSADACVQSCDHEEGEYAEQVRR
ncbi:MAG: anthranilate synthase component I, partial [Gammaproteobacteria bacterium]|nr:anthranilate synthase component I [Gammaproteobacteria bacterium]